MLSNGHVCHVVIARHVLILCEWSLEHSCEHVAPMDRKQDQSLPSIATHCNYHAALRRRCLLDILNYYANTAIRNRQYHYSFEQSLNAGSSYEDAKQEHCDDAGTARESDTLLSSAAPSFSQSSNAEDGCASLSSTQQSLNGQSESNSGSRTAPPLVFQCPHDQDDIPPHFVHALWRDNGLVVLAVVQERAMDISNAQTLLDNILHAFLETHTILSVSNPHSGADFSPQIQQMVDPWQGVHYRLKKGNAAPLMMDQVAQLPSSHRFEHRMCTFFANQSNHHISRRHGDASFSIWFSRVATAFALIVIYAVLTFVFFYLVQCFFQ